MRTQLLIISATFILSSACDFFLGKGTSKRNLVKNTQVVLDEDEYEPITTSTNADYATSGMVSNVNEASLINVNEDNPSLNGVSVLLPANSLSIPTTVSLQPANAIAETSLKDLELDQDIQIANQGKSVVIDNDKGIDPSSAFTIAIPQPVEASLVQDESAKLRYPLVIYRKFIYATGKVSVGIVASSKITIKDNKFYFQTAHFGVFQAIYMTSETEFEEKETETETTIEDSRSETVATPDSLKPTLTSVTLNDALKDGFLNIADTALTDDVIASVDASDYDMLKYAVVESASDCEASESYETAIPKINAILSRNDGSYKTCVQAMRVNSGLSAYKASEIFAIDRTTPDLSGLALNSKLDDEILNYSEHTLDEAVLNSISNPDNDTLTYALVSSDAACEDATFVAEAPLLSADALVNSWSFKLCIKASDTAGNSSIVASGAFTSNYDGPQFTVNLANEASDGKVNSLEQALANNLLDIPDAGTATLAYAALASSETCDGSVASFSETAPKLNTILSDGAYKICVRGLNSIGNYSYIASANIVYAITGPTISNQNLNAKVGANSIKLGWLKATDDGDDTLLEYRVCQSTSGNLTTLADIEANCTEAVAYTADIDYGHVENLSAAATYYFNVIVRDPDGNKQIYTQKQVTTQSVFLTYAVNSTNSGLYLSYSNGAGGWNATKVDGTSSFATTSDLGIASDGSLHIAFSGSSVHHTVWDGTNFSAYTTPFSGFASVGGLRMVVDSMDSPHIFASNDHPLMYTNWNGSAWTAGLQISASTQGYQTVHLFDDDSISVVTTALTADIKRYESTSSWGTPSTILSTAINYGYVDSDQDNLGNLHICYGHFSNSTVSYGTDASSSWMFTDIAGSLGSNPPCQIQVDGGNFAHIIYFDAPNKKLVHWRGKDTSFTEMATFGTGFVPSDIADFSLISDGNNHLYLAFHSRNGDQKLYLTQYNPLTSTWSAPLAIASGASESHGRSVRMIID